MALRGSRYLRWVGVCLGVVLLGSAVATTGFIETEYRATYYAQPVDSDEVQSSVTVRDVPPECRSVARQLTAGQTVSEIGYELRPGESTFLVRTNLSGEWQLSESVCGEQLLTGRALQSGGQYYHVWGTERKGKFWYRHKPLLSLSVLTGASLLIGGIGLDQNRTREG